jgi:threonine aldolase
VNLETVQTNMVFITVPDAAKTVQEWTDKGVWCGQMDVDKVRLVTHFQQSDDDIQYVLERIATA